jgi:hypothetical protein
MMSGLLNKKSWKFGSQMLDTGGQFRCALGSQGAFGTEFPDFSATVQPTTAHIKAAVPNQNTLE